ncbi:class II aldolase/adducin family protein [Streptomyces sp. TRM 70351]|uniref:class II aldolase/adducin family protein n=1 Tax=Streptomyces sp. TRM 70351 TaxID=3116552 RepID=UPI002E7AC3CD|nr:class II aldolase/adducin family protein [Streptomyces sp. TRM 70351]MEE1930614.1 class II aldolase/adducin family protein [Streptomyces sp. TRM 70351]
MSDAQHPGRHPARPADPPPDGDRHTGADASRTPDAPRTPDRGTAAALPPGWAETWRAVVATARRTVADGLVTGTSGNVSARVGDTVLVTPSGIPYDRLGPGDLCAVTLDGRPAAGHRVPTSELPLHLAVYRHTDAAAVVHTHAVHATAVSTLVDELPAVHYMAAALGGPVRVAPYARYGTAELAGHVLAALRGRSGCLLRNHGTVVYGRDLEQALDRTAQLEWMCRVWLAAASVPGGRPALLPPGELDAVAERLRGYGQPPTA